VYNFFIHNFFFFQNRLYIHALGSGQRESTLPLDVGTVSGYSGKKLQSEVYTFVDHTFQKR
jgi:hypothetical protein